MTAKTTYLAAAGAAPLPTRNGLFSDSAPFVSMCPTCKDSRSQVGYSARDLLRRINSGRPIEAFCIICNQFWSITAQERLRVAEELEHLRLI